MCLKNFGPDKKNNRKYFFFFKNAWGGRETSYEFFNHRRCLERMCAKSIVLRKISEKLKKYVLLLPITLWNEMTSFLHHES